MSSTLTLVGSLSPPGSTTDPSSTTNAVFISGNYAYVSDSSSVSVSSYPYVAYEEFLQIIDISDPTSPIVAGSYSNTNTSINQGYDYSSSLEVAGEYAYVAERIEVKSSSYRSHTERETGSKNDIRVTLRH
jgi:hypothetical protein